MVRRTLVAALSAFVMACASEREGAEQHQNALAEQAEVATASASAPVNVPVAAEITVTAEPSIAASSAEPQATAPPPCAPEPPLPAAEWKKPSDADLVALARDETRDLGTASIGTPTRGKLRGAMRLTPREGIVTAGDHPWGTRVAVLSIERAVRQVRRCFKGTKPIFVGDISSRHGGWLRPHRSHQSGLDADIGYYYLGEPVWFQTATADNLDRARTYALIRALVDGGTVETIFIDRRLILVLAEYAKSIGETEAHQKLLFGSGGPHKDGILQHAHGHATHFHARFTDPESVALGKRVEPLLAIHRPGTKRLPVRKAKPKPPPKPGAFPRPTKVPALKPGKR